MKNLFESEGEIREVDPLAAMVGCWRDRTTGALRFVRGASESGFDLDEGEVVAVVSSDPRFETAAILVRAGKLTAETVERLAPQGGDPALAALQTGLLTRREWKWGEKIRAIEVLSDLLTWNDGRYTFDATARPKAGDFRVPVPRLLLELFLRSRDRNLIDHQLGSPEQTLVRGELFDAEFPGFGLTADAESVVRLIDGRSTALEIAEKAPAEEFAVLKLLAALVTLGLVHPVPVAPARAADRVPEREFPPEPVLEIEPPPEPEPQTDEFSATLDLPTSDERSEEVFETEVPVAEVAPEPAAEREMVDLPSEEPVSPLDRFEPGPPAGGWESEPARPASDGPWGYAPETPEAPEGGEPPSPSGGGVSPLVWALVALLVAVAAIVVFRGRSASPAGTVAGAATPGPAVTFPPPVTAARPEGARDRTVAAPMSAAAPTPSPAPPPTAAAAVPTSRGAAATPVPSRLAKSVPAPSASKPTPMSSRAAAEAPPPAPGSWQARAARDRKRLDGERRTLYSIQLELVCEPASLEEAWRHDRGQAMWLLTVAHGGRDCFRVFWGRYPTVEAAKKAKPGIPPYFVTARNRPAVVSVR